MLAPVLLLAVSLALLLSACGASGGGGETASPSPSPSIAAPPLRMVANDVMPLISVVDGQVTGFSGELATEIAARLGRPLAVTIEPFDRLLVSVAGGDADLAMSAISITPEREKLVAFSTPYLESGQALLVRTGSGIHSTAGLRGKTVAVVAGTTNKQYAQGVAGVGRILTLRELSAAFAALRAGKADAVVCDTPFALYEARQTGTMEVAETLTTGDLYGIALRKDNVTLLQQVNDALAAIKADGTYDTLYQKYFGT